MRPEKEIRKKLRQVKINRWAAFNSNNDIKYQMWLRIEALLEWVLKDQDGIIKKEKRGERLKTAI